MENSVRLSYRKNLKERIRNGTKSTLLVLLSATAVASNGFVGYKALRGEGLEALGLSEEGMRKAGIALGVSWGSSLGGVFLGYGIGLVTRRREYPQEQEYEERRAAQS